MAEFSLVMRSRKLMFLSNMSLSLRSVFSKLKALDELLLRREILFHIPL
jgi:hypothetical protein